MSDSSVALGSGSTGTVANSVLNSYHCSRRLPCGYCPLRNMMCPVNASTITITSPSESWHDQSITGSISGESK